MSRRKGRGRPSDAGDGEKPARAPARGKPGGAPSSPRRGAAAARGGPSAAPPGRGRPPGSSFLGQSALLAGVLAVVTALAELFGAANLGVALGVGTIAFTIALMYVMLNR